MITENKIKKYIENETLYPRSLLIDDSWGKGKSSIIKNVLSGNVDNFKIDNNKLYLIVNANDINEKTSFRQLLIANSKKINTNNFLDQDDNDALSSKITNAFVENKKLFKTILDKSKQALDGYIENKTGMENVITNSLEIFGIGGESILKKMNYDDYILVIDEIDRMSDPHNLKNIYSKIIEIQENTKIRVIVIMNSSKIDQEYHDEWKDKIYSASIKVENTTYFNQIKPDIWNDVEEDLKKITPNYKNIRILEKYISLEKYIDKIINGYKNTPINKYQESKINYKKRSLITKLYIYYNKKDYQTALEKKNKNNRRINKFDEFEYKEMIEEIEKISNMDTHFLIKEFEKILDDYNDDYAKLQDAISYFYKNYFHKNQNIDPSKNKGAFKFAKNDLIKDNLNIINLTSIDRTGFGSEPTIMHIFNTLKETYKISINQEEEIISLIYKKLLIMRENFKKLTTKEKLNEFWTQEIIYTHIKKINCSKPTHKIKILKFLQRNMKILYKDIIMNYTDNMSQEEKHFHYKHNFNIIDNIFKNLNLDDHENLLFRLRDLKEYSSSEYIKKKNIYYSTNFENYKDKIKKSYIDRV